MTLYLITPNSLDHNPRARAYLARLASGQVERAAAPPCKMIIPMPATRLPSSIPVAIGPRFLPSHGHNGQLVRRACIGVYRPIGTASCCRSWFMPHCLLAHGSGRVGPDRSNSSVAYVSVLFSYRSHPPPPWGSISRFDNPATPAREFHAWLGRSSSSCSSPLYRDTTVSQEVRSSRNLVSCLTSFFNELAFHCCFICCHWLRSSDKSYVCVSTVTSLQ